jgi:hypothetical protein
MKWSIFSLSMAFLFGAPIGLVSTSEPIQAAACNPGTTRMVNQNRTMVTEVVVATYPGGPSIRIPRGATVFVTSQYCKSHSNSTWWVSNVVYDYHNVQIHSSAHN